MKQSRRDDLIAEAKKQSQENLKGRSVVDDVAMVEQSSSAVDLQKGDSRGCGYVLDNGSGKNNNGAEVRSEDADVNKYGNLDVGKVYDNGP